MPEESGSGSKPAPKAIPSLAKKPDVTRQGSSKLKFVPTLPQRRKPTDVKAEPTPPSIPAPSSSTSSRGRGDPFSRGRGDGTRGTGRGRGRGAGPPGAAAPPLVQMTASGPFALGPTMAGGSSASSSAYASRKSTPRSNFAITPGGGGSSGSAGLSGAPPVLKKDAVGEGVDAKGKGKAKGGAKTEDESDVEVYSDPDEGVEIIDMEDVRGMDWMAPESLKKEKLAKKKKGKGKKKAVKSEEGSVVEDDEEEDIDTTNALDLSASEDEADADEEVELEDIIEDFASHTNIDSGLDESLREEKIYLFQFPSPFPEFVGLKPKDGTDLDIEMTDVTAPPTGTSTPTSTTTSTSTTTKKVTFGADVKPPAAGTKPAGDTKDATETPKAQQPLDGLIGRLEVYRSGAVKIRLGDGILLDVRCPLPSLPLAPRTNQFTCCTKVTPSTQASFLQHIAHVQPPSSSDPSDVGRLTVLGEVNKQFVASPDVDALLEALERKEREEKEGGALKGLEADGLISMS
ncbi:RNA polymerase III RPC4-domain-containing protein [Coprinopsis sp. MPI-PUGE-AT-0042]|nr:RNA polymerase III RPC4-domain-containing protein [Coprinopsis sp. MPI-PUGE-AT-0042]